LSFKNTKQRIKHYTANTVELNDFRVFYVFISYPIAFKYLANQLFHVWQISLRTIFVILHQPNSSVPFEFSRVFGVNKLWRQWFRAVTSTAVSTCYMYACNHNVRRTFRCGLALRLIKVCV